MRIRRWARGAREPGERRPRRLSGWKPARLPEAVGAQLGGGGDSLRAQAETRSRAPGSQWWRPEAARRARQRPLLRWASRLDGGRRLSGESARRPN